MSTLLQAAAAELSDVESVPSSTTSPGMSRKQGREAKLREDVLCEVLNGTCVRCLNCGQNIKLSLKSDFDASHWLRHRGRCLKRSRALEKAAQSVETSPTSSARALSIPPAEEAVDSEIPDVTDPSLDTPAATLDVQPPPEWQSWQTWDWSQLKCRFPVPKDL
ncbi:hypothetical protein FB45DRAFT_1031087 [Roridomyces roridus]|uniref:Uncharacterized protein n=1 Tax=Roridomyces roridus TaxID=1738132 RepID=A0AAD7FGL7_9AGAR|nr:hypothetical protein FB45DRAFT_1031087 [Roridomyces roridus]